MKKIKPIELVIVALCLLTIWGCLKFSERQVVEPSCTLDRAVEQTY